MKFNYKSVEILNSYIITERDNWWLILISYENKYDLISIYFKLTKIRNHEDNMWGLYKVAREFKKSIYPGVYQECFWN